MLRLLTGTCLSSLAAVNFFLGMVGIVQVTRILLYNQSQKKAGLPAAAEEVKEEVKDKVKQAVNA